MKALVKYKRGEGNMKVVDVDEPSPRPYEVKIKVAACGICGSDLHIYHDDIKMLLNPPMVTGHEFSGTICEVGEGVTHFKAGDRVVSETTFETCGMCEQCRTGNYNLCELRKSIGFYANGAFTDYVIAKADKLHRIPENLDFHTAAVTEPLACCVNGIDFQAGGIRASDFVMIIGPGTLGLLSLQIAKANGARVAVAGLRRDHVRMKLAERIGADELLFVDDLPSDKPFHEKADIVMECSGHFSAISMGLDIVKRNGRYVQFGLSGREVKVPFELIAYKQIKVYGVFAHNWITWEKAIMYMEKGLVKTKPLISHILPITEWERAYQMMEKKESVKVLLEPISG